MENELDGWVMTEGIVETDVGDVEWVLRINGKNVIDRIQAQYECSVELATVEFSGWVVRCGAERVSALVGEFLWKQQKKSGGPHRKESDDV